MLIKAGQEITCEAGHASGSFLCDVTGPTIWAGDLALHGASDGQRSGDAYRCECSKLIARVSAETGNWQVHTATGWIP